jgi:hypothetical protein
MVICQMRSYGINGKLPLLIILLSLVLMLGSATSAVLFTSILIAFVQESRNSALQIGDQPAIGHLANLIPNKTDNVSVKPILEQMANEGNGPS